MSQLSPFAQFLIDELRDMYKEECVPDHVHVQALAKVFLTNDSKTPQHIVAIIKELQAHLT